MGKVMERLQQVHDGNVSFGTVVAEFRQRDWPTGDTPSAEDRMDRLADDPHIPAGDATDVTDAYHFGLITAEQYRTLYHVINGARGAKRPTPSDAAD